MTSEKDNILKSAQKIFLQEGFYKTPMAEIAAEMKISKKTIYKHFSSKEELVRESLLNFISQNNLSLSELIKKDSNAVEKCFRMFQLLSQMLGKISGKFINDIRNYMPELWKEIDKVRTKILYSNLKVIIEQGQSEGYFIITESEMLISIFIVSIRGVLNPDALISHNLSPSKTAETIIEILLCGILTEKGRKIFEKLKTGESK